MLTKNVYIYYFRHPYVLTFLASSEVDDSIAVVTEYGMPLEVWIKQYISVEGNESEKESILLEILWGLKCIVEACNFLHLSCKTSHSFISPQSCFVTKNGDWKLGFMDAACDLSADAEYYQSVESLLNKTYRSPERVDGTWGEKYTKSAKESTSNSGSAPVSIGSPVDIFSLGKIISFVFDTLSFLDMPECLEAPLKRMTSPDWKRRPACSALLRLPCFQSDQLNLMTSISELALKPPTETLEVFRLLTQKVDVISKAACTFKILPSIGHSLNQAVNDFQNRDARELCRQVS
jgi:serine/threonine protein kinase